MTKQIYKKNFLRKHWKFLVTTTVAFLALIVEYIGLIYVPIFRNEVNITSKYRPNNEIVTKNLVKIFEVMQGQDIEHKRYNCLLQFSPGQSAGFYKFQIEKDEDTKVDSLSDGILLNNNKLIWETQINSDADRESKHIECSLGYRPSLIDYKYTRFDNQKSQDLEYHGEILITVAEEVNSIDLFIYINKSNVKNCDFGTNWELIKKVDTLEYQKTFNNINKSITIPFNCDLINGNGELITDSSWAILYTDKLYGFANPNIESNILYELKTETWIYDYSINKLIY